MLRSRFPSLALPMIIQLWRVFFSNLKREELYRGKYRSERELRAAIDKYMNFYNTKRPHETLKYKTPQQKEEEYARAATAFGDT